MLPKILKRDATAEYYTEERCSINELSNSDADQDASIAEARVSIDECTRWHRLDGITERYVILSGEGRVEVGELKPVDVKVGDVVLIPPGCPQRIRNIGGVDLVFLAICTPRFEFKYYQDIEPEA